MAAYTAADNAARGNDARGRKPYLIQNTLDIAAQIVTNGADYAAGDTETMLNVPKGTAILSAGIEVVTSASGTTATVDLGFTGGVVDKYVDGLNIRNKNQNAIPDNQDAWSFEPVDKWFRIKHIQTGKYCVFREPYTVIGLPNPRHKTAKF